MVTSDNFTFKILNKDSIDDLIYLFELDGKKVTKKYLVNKYLYSSRNEKLNYLGCLLYDENGQPSAFIGGFYMILKNQTKELKAIQIGDVITNPIHRRKGLFIKVASCFFNFLSESKEFDLVFGFPNDNLATAYFEKLNWKKNVKLQTFSCKLPFINFYGLFHKISILTPIYNYYVNLILKIFKVDKFIYSNNYLIGSEFFVYKNEEFFKWKKSFSSGRLIKILGNVYFIKFIDGIQIDFIKIQNLKRIRLDIYIIGLLTGVKKLTTMQTLNSSLIKELKVIGFNKIDHDLFTGYLFLHDNYRYENFIFSISDADEF